ncbi:hypothetical protein LJB88_04425 [Erysipelotrichaceae bacterium OttesenSCG-928-M19]|nr:hypothetical protein [Erysipelotrichaceae bacterium OttesenSCG-928-M19]
MNISDYFKTEIINIEYYGARKPKFHKDEQTYYFEENSLVALSTFDNSSQLKNFFKIIKEKLENTFMEFSIKDYSNDDNFEGFIYLDQMLQLNYQEKLNQQLTSITLLGDEALSFSYLLVKCINAEGDDLLIWFKLKSPLKIENNTFNYASDNYDLKITKDGLTIDNYPSIKLDLNGLAFICIKDDFYIINKDLYQKYFNLESYYYYQAEKIVYQNDNIISDGQLLTKTNAKLVYEYFDFIDDLCAKIKSGVYTEQQIKHNIERLNLQLDFNNDNKFILKKAQDLVDLLLLSAGCYGINSLNDEVFKVKKPQYLVDEV